MNTAGQKKRTPNFSSNEKNILSELVVKYKELIENKKTDATTNAQKVVGWSRVAEEFNSLSSECYRNPNSLKTCWENIKRMVKKEKAYQKKEFFMTGGGKPQPTTSSSIVEVVLGPALEGLPNIYDSDAVDELITTQEPLTLPEKTTEPSQAIYSHFTDNVNIIGETEEEKENSEPAKSLDLKTKIQNDELWQSWTPKNLKRQLAEPLRCVKRRRPVTEALADVVLKEKIELIKILKQNAIDEGNLRVQILQEQLKQEKIKTEKMLP